MTKKYELFIMCLGSPPTGLLQVFPMPWPGNEAFRGRTRFDMSNENARRGGDRAGAIRELMMMSIHPPAPEGKLGSHISG
jgi:hypothetical protein